MQTKLLNRNIIFSENVLNVFKFYIQDDKTKHESGGILLGQVAGNNVYVLKASIPNNFDKSSRYSFERNKDIAQITVNYEFANTNGKTIYLGEWHTHPEDIPTPSGQDRKMIKEQMKLGKPNLSFLLLYIQGIQKSYLGICESGILKEHTIFNQQ